MKAKLKYLTKKTIPATFDERIIQINWLLRGWTNYFKLASMQTKLKSLDEWCISQKKIIIKLQQMKLYTYCKSCKAEIHIKSSAPDRAELEREKGLEFDVICKKCSNIEKKHVNDINAKPSRTLILAGVIIGIIVTVVLWGIYGAISTISGIIPLLFGLEQTKSSKLFNSYMLRRK